MFKKIITSLLLFIFINSNFFCIFADTIPLIADKLYYLDSDNNLKIDTFEIVFNQNISWNIDFTKIFLSSNTWGLSSSRLDSLSGNSIFSSSKIKNNFLQIKIQEQDNSKTDLKISNTTSWDLRLKANSWNWIKSIWGEEMSLSLSTSFWNYKNVEFATKSLFEEEKIIEENNTNTGSLSSTWSQNQTNSWSIDNLISNTWSLSSSWNENWVNTNSWSLENSWIQTNTWIIIDENNSNSWTQNKILDVKLDFQSPTYFINAKTENDIFDCDRTKTDCRVNFNLIENSVILNISKYECLWDFWLNSKTGEENKCNPNTIIYPIWNFKTKVLVTEKNNISNNFSKEFLVTNLWYKEPEKIVVYSNSSYSSSNYIYPKAKITLQWSLTSDKKLSNNNLICEVEDWSSCNLNLTWDESVWSWLKYTWFLGNKFLYDWKNPVASKYPIWEYIFTLLIKDEKNNESKDIFYLSVINKTSSWEKNENLKQKENDNKVLENNIKLDENIKNNVLISRILPNPAWVDNYEWIELKNNFENTLDLTNCNLELWTKKYSLNQVKIEWNSALKFFKEQTNFSIKNSWDNIIFSCLWEKIDNFSRDFKVIDDFILNRENISLNGKSFILQKIIDNDIFVLENQNKSQIYFKNIWINISDINNLDDLIWKTFEIKLEKDILDKFWNISWYLFISWENLWEFLVSSWNAIVDEKIDFSLKNKYLELQNTAKQNKIWVWTTWNKIKSSVNKQKKQYVLSLLNQLEDIKNDQNIDSNLKIDLLEDKKENLKQYLKTNFSLNLKHQKSWLKISGAFIPESSVFFEVFMTDKLSFFDEILLKTYASNIYEAKTDENGKYSLLIEDINAGKYEVLAKTNITNEEIELATNSEIEVENEDNPLEKDIINQVVKWIISLQTKASNTKIITNNSIKCLNSSSCSVNFTWEKSLWKKLNYFWDFGNWDVSTKSNPAWINFEKWKYLISLKVTDWKNSDFSTFSVEVEGKETKESLDNLVDNITKNNILNNQIMNSWIVWIPIYKEIIIYVLLFLLFLAFSYIILKEKDII